MAVNFWWDHYSSLGIMEKQSTCQGHCDPSFTLDQVELRGQDVVLDDFNSIRCVQQVVVELSHFFLSFLRIL